MFIFCNIKTRGIFNFTCWHLFSYKENTAHWFCPESSEQRNSLRYIKHNFL
jgi:hypothetical protein